MTVRRAKMNVVKAWAGYVDGRLGTWCQDTRCQFAVFRFRLAATQRYEDVRPVHITPVHGKRNKRKRK